MTVYIIMLAISLFFASCAGRIRGIQEYKKVYRVYAVLSFLPFFIVSALRYEVGTDWIIYDDFFYGINEGTKSFKEPLFNLLNKVIYMFSEDSQFLFIAIAALSLGFTFAAIYKQSKYIPFSILVFFLSVFYFNSLNQMRQGISMSIFLFAMQYIESRDWKKYFFWVLIAIGIHFSALIYIPLYFIYGWKADLKKHIILFVGVLLGMPVLKVVLVKLITLTPYAWYFESMFKNDDFLLAGFVVSFVILMLMEYYNYIADEEDDKMYSLAVNMQWCCVICLLCTGFIPQVSRIASAFEVGTILSIPRIVLKEKDRNRRIVLYCIIVLLLAVRILYDIYICGFYWVVPYKSIFSR